MQTRLSLQLSDSQRMVLGSAIRTARVAKKWTQSQLGEHFSVSKSAVAQWESGKNMPDPRKLAELIRVLALDPHVAIGSTMGTTSDPVLPKSSSGESLSAKRQNEEVAPPSPPRRNEMPKDVPILGTTVGGRMGDFEMNVGEPVDFARRPPRIEGRRDVFCLFVQGTSMAPWRQPGDLIYVEAYKPPQNGDYVVIEMLPTDSDDIRPAYLKRLLSVTSTKLRVQQYSPAKTYEIERRKVGRLLRVMDWSELLAV